MIISEKRHETGSGTHQTIVTNKLQNKAHWTKYLNDFFIYDELYTYYKIYHSCESQ